MKYQAVSHPKMYALAAKFGGNRVLAVGIVESVIALALHLCQRGDVGKFTDEQIEDWVGWTGEPGAMVRALVECRWLDEDKDHRLVIHDWKDHAPGFVHSNADKASKKRNPEPYFIYPIPPLTSKYKKPDSSKLTRIEPSSSPAIAPLSQGNGILSCSVLSHSVLSCPVPLHSESGDNHTTTEPDKPTLTPQQQALDAKLKALFPKKVDK